jgi:hypothetical protein
LITNQNGEALAEFYTGDRKTELEVMINGITTGGGHTGEGKTTISIANKK